MGMVDWVAETPEEFVAIAKSKSQDIDGLAALRMGLRERFSQSTLGSPERFALEFESALAEAYSKLAKYPETDPEFMP
jgi:predicted O-linked N-acetylglucosamine transferase (SPINDLY family)